VSWIFRPPIEVQVAIVGPLGRVMQCQLPIGLTPLSARSRTECARAQLAAAPSLAEEVTV